MSEQDKKIIFKDAFDIQNENGDSPYLLLVEHARNSVPEALNNLGLSDEDIGKHIAWDIGIEDVSRTLSDTLNAPAIYGTYSRLLAEINRPVDHPDLFREIYDEIEIPGNMNLSDVDKELRIQQIYEPYHKAAKQLAIDHIEKVGKDNLMVIGMHSCTPQLSDGKLRPWHVGMSTYDSEPLMTAIAERLSKKGYNVGVHEPYNLKDYPGVGIDLYGRSHGAQNILIEIRQDLIDSKDKARLWAQTMSDIFTDITSNRDSHDHKIAC